MTKGPAALAKTAAAACLAGVAWRALRPDAVVGDGGAPSADQSNPTASEDDALFTHAGKQLHCLDRELRHPCVTELRAYIDDKGNDTSKRIALDCVEDVLASSDVFFVLKNMTHLLLDLDTVVHAFDGEGRDGDFVRAGLSFADKLIAHRECLDDFDTKSELECRCLPLYAKVSILKLKNAGRVQEARNLFDRVTNMSWNGNVRTYESGQAVRWDHFQHTPQIWVPGLRSQQLWPRETWGDLPICSILEENFAIIREEALRSLKGSSNEYEDAYRFLYGKGEWTQLMLYHKQAFTDECENILPKTCAMLKQWLPSKPGLPWTSDQNEQVMVLRMKVGTDVETHCGPANNILNIHIGISGLTGAKLIVANETYEWEEGKVIAWDGSFDHRVHCLDCTEDRIIMMVRYMHPDMAARHYKGSTRTHFEEIPTHMQ